MMFLTSTDRSLITLSVVRGSRRLDVLFGTQCIDFLIISPSCFAGDFCLSNPSRSAVNHSTLHKTILQILVSILVWSVQANFFKSWLNLLRQTESRALTSNYVIYRKFCILDCINYVYLNLFSLVHFVQQEFL